MCVLKHTVLTIHQYHISRNSKSSDSYVQNKVLLDLLNYKLNYKTLPKLKTSVKIYKNTKHKNTTKSGERRMSKEGGKHIAQDMPPEHTQVIYILI